MSSVYTSDFTPDPSSTVDVLAFVLCPVTALAPRADAEELEAVAEMIGPAKAEAIRRWQEARRVSEAN